MQNLTFQYPTWYLLLCIALGLGYALTLYFKDKTFAEQHPQLHKLLGVLRFLVVTLLAILLLEPLLKSLLTETKKPVVVLAQDESESVGAALSVQDLETYKANWAKMKDDLSAKYEVKEYGFGSEVREGTSFEMKDKISNISKLMTETTDLYAGQNLGAVVLATDGIYNEGSNPLYAGNKLNAPVFAVALGDTTQRKDLVLKRVFHNKIAYLGDKFNVQFDVAARNCANANTTVTISKLSGSDVRNLQTIPLTISGNDFFTTRELVLDANEAGVQRYRISLSQVSGEKSMSFLWMYWMLGKNCYCLPMPRTPTFQH
jgi:hypothetical protein